MPSHWLTQKRVLAVIIAGLLVCSLLPSRVVDVVARGPRVLVQTITTPPIALVSMVTPDIREAKQRELIEGASREQLRKRYAEAWSHNQNLRRRLERLKASKQQLEAALARLPAGQSVAPVEAPVAGLTGSSSNPQLSIAKGTRTGLEPGQAVVIGGSLVGEIVSAGPVTATVRLITAKQTSLWVTIQPPQTTGPDQAPPRQAGLRVTWDPAVGAFTAEPSKREPIEVGDMAQLDDDAWPIAAQGYIVGKVTKVEADAKQMSLQRVRVKPLVPLKQLDRVAVLVPQQ